MVASLRYEYALSDVAAALLITLSIGVAFAELQARRLPLARE